MKIKMDFISNSSSTSFIYISDHIFNEKEFYDAIGIDKSNPMFDFFESLFETLYEAVNNGSLVNDVNQIPSTGNYPNFTPEVVQRASEALKKGEKVILGGLSSEESLPESLLCMEIFEIDSDQFYINAYDNYW